MFNEIEIKNQKELLRVLGNDLKNAKTDAQKTKLNGYITAAKDEISKLEACAKN